MTWPAMRSIRSAVRTITSQRARSAASVQSSAAERAAVAISPSGARSSWYTMVTGSAVDGFTLGQPVWNSLVPYGIL